MTTSKNSRMSVMKIQNTPEWTDAVHTFQYTANVHPRVLYTQYKKSLYTVNTVNTHTPKHICIRLKHWVYKCITCMQLYDIINLISVYRPVTARDCVTRIYITNFRS